MTPTRTSIKLRTVEVCELTGLAFMTLNRWATAGVVEPEVGPSGSGSRAQWSQDDLRRVQIIARLGGMFPTGLPVRVVAAVWRALDPWPHSGFVVVGPHARVFTTATPPEPGLEPLLVMEL